MSQIAKNDLKQKKKKSKNNTRPVLLIAIHINTKKIKNKIDKKEVKFHR